MINIKAIFNGGNTMKMITERFITLFTLYVLCWFQVLNKNYNRSLLKKIDRIEDSIYLIWSNAEKNGK